MLPLLHQINICTAWPLKRVIHDKEKVLKCSHHINQLAGGWGHTRTTKCAAQLVPGCNVHTVSPNTPIITIGSKYHHS
jgi:hypothetical protein